MNESCCFSTSSPAFDVASVLDFNRSHRCVVVSRCCSNLHFPDDVPWWCCCCLSITWETLYREPGWPRNVNKIYKLFAWYLTNTAQHRLRGLFLAFSEPSKWKQQKRRGFFFLLMRTQTQPGESHLCSLCPPSSCSLLWIAPGTQHELSSRWFILS